MYLGHTKNRLMCVILFATYHGDGNKDNLDTQNKKSSDFVFYVYHNANGLPSNVAFGTEVIIDKSPDTKKR